MSFSNNSSRTVLKDQAIGVNLKLTGKLITPEIYLDGENIKTLLNGETTLSTKKLDANCTGTNLTLSSALISNSINTNGITSTAITNSGGLVTGSITTSSILNNGQLVTSGISCAGVTSCHRLEVGPGTTDTFTYIDIRTSDGSEDYDARFGVSGWLASQSGKG